MLIRPALPVLVTLPLAVVVGLLVGAGQAPMGLWPLTLIGVAGFAWLMAGRGKRAAFGLGYLAGLAAGEPLRAAWNPVPVFGAPGDWAGGVLDAVGATLSAGRGAIVVVPDGDALDALVARCTAAFGKGSFTTLTAELGPATRYRNFLAVARGDVRLVLGTRAAVYAPVHDLGLVAVWDEGNDLLAEPRAPYPHAREVAALRAGLEHSALLLAGYGRTAEVQALVEKGWLVALAHEPREVRRLGPAVHAASHSDRAEDRDPAARAARKSRAAWARAMASTIRRMAGSRPTPEGWTTGREG